MLNLLSLKEAASESRTSIHTWRAWGYQRKFPIIKLGRRCLIRREDFEKFVTQHVVEARSDDRI